MLRYPHYHAGNIEWDFLCPEVDFLLSDVIDKFQNVVSSEVFDDDAFINPSIKSKLWDRATDLEISRRDSRKLLKRFFEFMYETKDWDTSSDLDLSKFEEEILRHVYRVEYITSFFLCKREMGKKMIRERSLMVTKMVMSSLPVFFNTLIDQRVLHNEMQKVKLDFKAGLHPSMPTSGLQNVKEDLFGYDDRPLKRTESSWDDDIDISESEAVGFKEEQERLFQEIYHGEQSYISILGRASSGKTSLARNVYKRVVKRGDFKMCVWVTVSPNYNIGDVCAAILLKTESTRKNMYEFSQLGSQPTESLFQRVSKKLGNSGKFIIVLDDVDHHIWSDIEPEMEHLFPIIPGSGSRVVFTTSDAPVAKRTKVIEHNGLSDEGSWALFCFNEGNRTFDARADFLMREIIPKTCTGLPIEVITLASLFMTKRSCFNLYHPHNDSDIEEISSSKFKSLIRCDLQYNMLPPTIRLCYLYMALFPKAFPIPIRRLIRLWIAEGLVIKSDIRSKKTREDVALSYLMKLHTRQMVQVTEKNGRPKTCQIPEVMHEFFCNKAKDIGIFHVHNELNTHSGTSRSPKFDVGRLAGHVDIKNYPTSDTYIQHLRSYISFDTRKRDTPTQKQIGVFLDQLTAKRGFGLLRVLDLEGVYKPLLTAETLRKLFLLTYLGLRWTLLDSLPDSIGGLQYLEALDVKHTNITSLPSSIWKAKNLRHLYMNQVYFDMSINRSFTTRLTKLQTLWGLSIGSNSLVVNWLSKLIELRKLGLTYHPTTAQAIANWVAQLTNLQSLRLRSIDEFGEPSDLKLPNMSKLDNLSDLYLVGVLQVPDSVEDHEFQFPSNLKILTLTGSKLMRNDLQMLGKLNQLNTLRFYGHSYWGDELIFYKNEFPKLVVLKLWMLEKLNKLELQEHALPSVEEIDIRLCHNLKNVNGLEQRSHPLRMTLTNMPADFVQNVKSVVHRNVAVEVQELDFSSI
ncbi:hypothetical protein FNV43_RR08097 [Rhamnella rubrinervis]|uniref:NB-ARC domain-containing protein n=1 Tax=Rhamnella rubrinervis TaxID=2594499 RepID=A0A8K0MMS0_9ROSA|nr:hypothetical protein FNV43_RR08097 [Rhamnella rubrinervis]